MTLGSPLKIGDWTFDPARRQLCRGTIECRISPKASSVLSELARADGHVCTRQELLDAVWPDVTVGEEVLTHAISELRRALRDRKGGARHIETIAKSGYRLACAVRPVGDHAMMSPALMEVLPPALSLDHYTTYLAARRAFARGGRTAASKAIDLLRDVGHSDTGFAPASAQLATALVYHADFYGDADIRLQEALIASRNALAIDPKCTETLCAHGLVMYSTGKIELAKRAFAAALTIDRNSFDAHYHLGRLCLWSGEYEAAVCLLDQAARLGGDDYHAHHLAASALMALGRCREADSRYYRARIALDLSCHLADSSVRGLVVAVACNMATGNATRAAELADEVASRPDPAPRVLAVTFARAGMVPEALDMLEHCADEGPRLFGWIGADPAFIAMQTEPRYQRLERTLAH
ncbi:MAG: winged helix-turn-helix domain-containing protein [Pseudomonadota bacterium]